MTKDQVLDPEEFVKFVDQRMVNMEDVARALVYAYNAGENIIMFGEGGYGKTDIAGYFNQYLYLKQLTANEKPYVQALGTGTTQEFLLGGVDIKKFNEESVLHYKLEESFANSEIVVFEEMWDCQPSVLLILKDILQSGWVRNGSQQFKIKTRMVIACTNKSREEVVVDDSTEALMQRFLFEIKVGWSSHNKDDYYRAIKKRYSFENAVSKIDEETLAHMEIVSIAASAVNQHMSREFNIEKKVSPRTAVKVFNTFLNNNYSFGVLNGIYGFSYVQQTVTEQFNKTMKKRKQKILMEKLNKYAKKAETDSLKYILTSVENNTIGKESEFTALAKFYAIALVLDKINNDGVEDANSDFFQTKLRPTTTSCLKEVIEALVDAAKTTKTASEMSETMQKYVAGEIDIVTYITERISTYVRSPEKMNFSTEEVELIQNEFDNLIN